MARDDGCESISPHDNPGDLHFELINMNLECACVCVLFCCFAGLVLISGLMILTSLAMFAFPKHLRGKRIAPPEKMNEAETEKKLEKVEEEAKPQLKGKAASAQWILIAHNRSRAHSYSLQISRKRSNAS